MISRKMDTSKPNTITAQRIFDHVVASLAEQGRASKNERNHCVYRGTEGRKCAAGFMIPDELYSLSMDFGYQSGPSITVVVNNDPALGYLKPHLSLVSHLQCAHDLAHDTEDFKARLREIAKRFKLRPAMVGTVTEWSRG